MTTSCLEFAGAPHGRGHASRRGDRLQTTFLPRARRPPRPAAAVIPIRPRTPPRTTIAPATTGAAAGAEALAAWERRRKDKRRPESMDGIAPFGCAAEGGAQSRAANGQGAARRRAAVALAVALAVAVAVRRSPTAERARTDVDDDGTTVKDDSSELGAPRRQRRAEACAVGSASRWLPPSRTLKQWRGGGGYCRDYPPPNAGYPQRCSPPREWQARRRREAKRVYASDRERERYRLDDASPRGYYLDAVPRLRRRRGGGHRRRRGRPRPRDRPHELPPLGLPSASDRTPSWPTVRGSLARTIKFSYGRVVRELAPSRPAARRAACAHAHVRSHAWGRRQNRLVEAHGANLANLPPR